MSDSLGNVEVTQATDEESAADAGALGSIVDQICAEHAKAAMAVRDAIGHAMNAGRLLIEAKEQLPHGGWLSWLGANCPYISPRTAQAYMRLSRATPAMLEDKSAAVAHLTIRKALAMVAQPRRLKSVNPPESGPSVNKGMAVVSGQKYPLQKILQGFAEQTAVWLPASYPELFQRDPEAKSIAFNLGLALLALAERIGDNWVGGGDDIVLRINTVATKINDAA